MVWKPLFSEEDHEYDVLRDGVGSTTSPWKREKNHNSPRRPYDWLNMLTVRSHC